jgi:8-oxo-dGTP pyrophosphatase MutT (NUDIX family)
MDIQALPGFAAQSKMIPQHRINLALENKENYKKSAVMILLCEDEQKKVFIPLIKRKSYQGTHSAQISLPGGKFDVTDEHLANTAKRECFEEIGIENIELILPLTSLLIPVSKFDVQPFVGVYHDAAPSFVINQREVDFILPLKIYDLLNDEKIKETETVISSNQKIIAPYFELESEKIWGATAMILSELKDVLQSIL